MIKNFLGMAFIAMLTFSAQAQEKKVFTAADYDRATKFLGPATNKLVYRNNLNPTWLPDGRFWYSVNIAGGKEFVLIDPAKGSRKTAADQKTLLADYPETKAAAINGRRGASAGVSSPDGKKVAFIKDWNLWLRDVGSNKETQLTTNGVKDFGYATDNAGWTHSDRPILLWSPDSRKIATFQQDQRHVSDMYLASTKIGAPNLEAWKYPLPGDKDIIRIERVIIEVDQAKVIRLKIQADPRRGTLCDDISCSGSFDDNQWNADASGLAFVSSSRDHKVQ